MDKDAVLFHVTYYGRLESIAEDGLVRGAPKSIGAPAYDYHRAKGVFLTDVEGIFHWYHKAEDFAEHESENYIEDGAVPVVLRVADPGDLVEDDVANSETLFENYISPGGVVSEDIEVWTGREWVAVDRWEDVDPEQSVKWVDDVEEDDEEYSGYWQFLNTSPLLPDEKQAWMPGEVFA